MIQNLEMVGRVIYHTKLEEQMGVPLLEMMLLEERVWSTTTLAK